MHHRHLLFPGSFTAILSFTLLLVPACEHAPKDAGSSGSGGSGGTGGSDGSGDTASFFPWVCTGPVAVDVQGKGSGLVGCDERFQHRQSAVTCPSLVPRDSGGGAGGLGGSSGACEQDADCPGDHPWCTVRNIEKDQNTECIAGCVEDSECGEGFVCECGFTVGTCQEARCRTDADCGEDSLCVRTLSFPANYPDTFTYACTKPEDQCVTDEDCRRPINRWVCILRDEHRSCEQINLFD